jgi:hypothetical protein
MILCGSVVKRLSLDKSEIDILKGLKRDYEE